MNSNKANGYMSGFIEWVKNLKGNIPKCNHLRDLMQGLIYPAFLGAALVWVLYGFANQYQKADEIWCLFKNVENWFSIWFILYFCAPFLILSSRDAKRKYNIISFIADIGDVSVIFIALLNLGFVSSSYPVDILHVYYSVFFMPIFAGIGNWSIERKIRWKVSSVAIGVAVAMINLIPYIETLELNWQFLNIANGVALFILFINMAFYFKDLEVQKVKNA